MTIIYKRNQNTDGKGSAVHAHKTWFTFMEDLIANGWRVLGSGDGDTFENDGQTAGSSGTGSGGGFDVITRTEDLAQITLPSTVSSLSLEGSWGNESAFPDLLGACWRRIATPADAEHYCEFLFQMNVGGGGGISQRMIIRYCRGTQRFDNGASAWVRPSVNTGVAFTLGGGNTGNSIIDEVPPTSSDKTTFFAPTSNWRAHWYIGDSSVDYDFKFYANRISASVNGEIFSSFGRARLVTAAVSRSDGSPDPDPYILFTQFETAGGNTNHNWNNNELFGVDTTSFPADEQRLEDRVGAGQLVDIWMSFGLGDPGVPASIQGHYGGALIGPGSGPNASDDYAWNAMLGKQPGTDRSLVDTTLKAGLISDQPLVQRNFFKGVLKNDWFGLSSRRSDLPHLEEGPQPLTDPVRVQWGSVSI